MRPPADPASPPKPRRSLDEAECERLVDHYAPLVAAIARSLLRRLPANVEEADLVQDGYVGLLVAIVQNTAEQAGKRYTAYLSQRIRGAMLDGLREADPATRRLRHDMRRIERTINALSQRLGRGPIEGEVAEALGMALPAYQRCLLEAEGYTLLSLDDFNDEQAERDFIAWCAEKNVNPLAALERKIVQSRLLKAISDLGEREEAVVRGYLEDIPPRDTARALGISEGRVSQLRTQAIAKLRAALLADETGETTLLRPRWRVS